MLLGYNTNGFAHHALPDAIDLLAEIGYRSVAITLDHASLNPFGDDLASEIAATRERLAKHGMQSVIETGARYLLDPRTKHEPTLMTGDANGLSWRRDFLCRAIDVAVELGSQCVSLWSGILRDDITDSEAFRRLLSAIAPVVEYAVEQDTVLAFEPEPGMFIDTMNRFDELSRQVACSHFRLTLDVGHLHCLGEIPIADQIHRFGSQLANVHIEDMCRGVHEHRMFGDGEMDFAPILRALSDVGYRGGIHVELSRDSHRAPQVAQQSFDFLSNLISEPT